MLIYRQRVLVFLILLSVLFFFSRVCLASLVGVYGVNKDSPELSQYGVSTVFLPPKVELIESQVAAGRNVFLAFNVFGGTRAWEMFPDSIPITATGERLNGANGGVCPTHSGWREARLSVLADWVREFGGKHGVSGIWLDFIRYPGRWEQVNPDLPDTCYCDRCLTLFQAEKAITIPPELVLVKDKAVWVKAHVPFEWMAWKKEQITSFVHDAREVLDQNVEGRKLKLGIFLVPWRKSDFDSALSFQLAQDAVQFQPYVDVFSPMAYHRMVGRPVSWISEITDYYAGMTRADVWPIVQAEGVEAQEFAQVLQSVSKSKAAGMLVYKFSDLAAEHWPLFEQFELPQNLFLNPRLKRADGTAVSGESTRGQASLPDHWFTSPVGRVQDSTFWIEPQDDGNAIGLTAGYDRQAIWTTDLPDCLPGKSYLFSADFLRQDRGDNLAYPEISLWGKDYRLNTHRMTGRFQRLKTIVRCPESYSEDHRTFKFSNNYPGNTFWMASPELVEVEPADDPRWSTPDSNFFPIGTYGANSKNLEEIKRTGLNSAVVPLNKESIEACLALNMRCTLSVPRSPEKLLVAIDRFESLLQQGQFSYYVNDEPGIHSFSEGKAEDIQRIIKQHFPKAVTNMAVVRPQVIPFYEKGADYFMLDQYPVPNMPMSWLSDSMDEAARHVGRDRLQSVIQAFGGDNYAGSGWPRLPTFAEMNCLTFLSVIHGSRGIYFYTFPGITSTDQSKEDFSQLVRRLNSMRSWLQVHNDDEEIAVRMTSPYRFDPRGNPAVHCARKEQYNTRMLICANTLRTYTEAEIESPAEMSTDWEEYYTSAAYLVVDGTIFARFAPLEVKALIEAK